MPTNTISIFSDLSKNEEDYLKALYHLTDEAHEQSTGTNKLADYLGISPASVNGMIKKLKSKQLVDSERYRKLKLTSRGSFLATQLIRKHRLWETFLYEHLNFTWDEVHEVAEQLEHIKSPKLIQQLDAFLGHPETDPHGDAIPNAEGKISQADKKSLAETSVGVECHVVSVKDASVAFLQMVSKLGIGLNTSIKVVEIQEFDASLVLEIEGKKKHVSQKFAENVFVKVTA